MSESKKLELQTRAVLIQAPGVGYVVKFDDGSAMALSPELATNIANQILAAETGATSPLPIPLGRTQFLQ